MGTKMKYQIKDRVVLSSENKNKNTKGTIVKIYKGKNSKVRTCGVVWDTDWPDVRLERHKVPGKVFYYKPEDLTIVGTWRLT